MLQVSQFVKVVECSLMEFLLLDIFPKDLKLNFKSTCQLSLTFVKKLIYSTWLTICEFKSGHVFIIICFFCSFIRRWSIILSKILFETSERHVNSCFFLISGLCWGGSLSCRCNCRSHQINSKNAEQKCFIDRQLHGNMN